MSAGEGRRTFCISIYHCTYHGFIMDYHEFIMDYHEFIMDYHELDNKCIYL